MKGRATGIIRRIDTLGRVVIPMEIRRTMRLREGEPMEIFTGGEGELILRKYSPIEEMSSFTQDYVQVVAQTLSCLVCICDLDQIIAAAGPGQGEYHGKKISREMEEVITERRVVKGRTTIPVLDNGRKEEEQIIYPILSSGDAIGAVILQTSGKDMHLSELEEKQVKIGAAFVGKQMEG